jgi:hypothetical protein
MIRSNTDAHDSSELPATSIDSIRTWPAAVGLGMLADAAKKRPGAMKLPAVEEYRLVVRT